MPLLVRLHLTSRTDRPSPTEQSSLCLLLLLFFQEGLEGQSMQLLIDVESWSTNTTATLTVSLQQCLFHYFHLLLQDQYLRAEASSLHEGCFASSPFSQVFSVVASLMREKHPVCDNRVLHYAAFFMSPQVPSPHCTHR